MYSRGLLTEERDLMISGARTLFWFEVGLLVHGIASSVVSHPSLIKPQTAMDPSPPEHPKPYIVSRPIALHPEPILSSFSHI